VLNIMSKYWKIGQKTHIWAISIPTFLVLVLVLELGGTPFKGFSVLANMLVI